MKFRAQVISLFALVAVTPLALLTAFAVPDLRRAVKEREQANQASAAVRAVDVVDFRIGRHLDDTMSIATALGALAGDNSDAALGAIKAVVGSRQSIPFVRLQIPEKKLDTVLGRAENDADAAPRATEELMVSADRDGVAFSVIDQARGAITVAVPTSPIHGKPVTKAYVTAPVYLDQLAADLATIADEQGMRQAGLMVFSNESRFVAQAGVWRGEATIQAAEDLLRNLLPEGIPQTRAVSSVDHVKLGQEVYVASLAHYRATTDDGTHPRFGFVVLVARPQDIAYADVASAVRKILTVAAAALGLMLVSALVLSRSIVNPIERLRQLAAKIARREYSAVVFGKPRSDEIGELDREIVNMAHELQSQEEQIVLEVARRNDLGRFLDREVVDRVVRGEQSLELGGTRMDVTVLFADVVSFTPFAESHPAEQVVGLLNELFTILSEVVFRHHGVVDKFIGDCIMAVFGAPEPSEDHAERAVGAAEDMMRFLETVSEAWEKKYGIAVRLGIGIHTGSAIVGNVGSKRRMEYTVVGDVANVASRLESIARPNQVLVSEATKDRTVARFPYRLLGPTQLVGRQGAVVVYALEVE